MARYAIGDIQGCYSQLMQLVHSIDFNPSKDVIYLVGDLVNRGPQSLEVLQWVYKYQDSVIVVLGNHDIYLLARHGEVREADKDETIGSILSYKRVDKLIDYLRGCPLVYHDNEYILVHAGIHPLVDFATLMNTNMLIQKSLKHHNYLNFISKIYGNKPNLWSNKLSVFQQMKFMINSCTRMRYLKKQDYALNYKYKGDLADMPDNLVPWFKVSLNPTVKHKILFGHWASLGFYHDNRFIALDTGCVWHRSLTAINLENFEIHQVRNDER